MTSRHSRSAAGMTETTHRPPDGSISFAETACTAGAFCAAHPLGASETGLVILRHGLLRVQLAQVAERHLLPLLGDFDSVLNVRHGLRGNLAEQAVEHLQMLARRRLDAVVNALLLRWCTLNAPLAERRIQTFDPAVVIGECGFESGGISGFSPLLSLLQVLLILLEPFFNLLKSERALIIVFLLRKQTHRRDDQGRKSDRQANCDQLNKAFHPFLLPGNPSRDFRFSCRGLWGLCSCRPTTECPPVSPDVPIGEHYPMLLRSNTMALGFPQWYQSSMSGLSIKSLTPFEILGLPQVTGNPRLFVTVLPKYTSPILTK